MNVPKPDELKKCLVDSLKVINQTVLHTFGKPTKSYHHNGTDILHVYKSNSLHLEVGIYRGFGDGEFSGKKFINGESKRCELLEIKIHEADDWDKAYAHTKKVRDICLAKCIKVINPYRIRNGISSKELTFTDPGFDGAVTLWLEWNPTDDLLE